MRGKGKRKTQGGGEMGEGEMEKKGERWRRERVEKKGEEEGGEGVRKEQEIERAPEEVRILAELMLSESTRSGRKRTEP